LDLGITVAEDAWSWIHASWCYVAVNSRECESMHL